MWQKITKTCTVSSELLLTIKRTLPICSVENEGCEGGSIKVVCLSKKEPLEFREMYPVLFHLMKNVFNYEYYKQLDGEFPCFLRAGQTFHTRIVRAFSTRILRPFSYLHLTSLLLLAVRNYTIFMYVQS